MSIDTEIEELKMKQRLIELEKKRDLIKQKEKELAELTGKPVAEPFEEVQKNIVVTKIEADTKKTETVMNMIRRGDASVPAPALAQQLPPDPVQQFLKQQGTSVEQMQTEDSVNMPRRVAAAEVLKMVSIIVLLGTLNIVFGFMLYMFAAIGLRIVSDISLALILIVDGFYMMKAARHRNYLVKKYQLIQPRTIFSLPQRQPKEPKQGSRF
ncbi:MAG: hypothetical protein MUP17_05020 [candidate division Zixibacteria bacterium]|nr:hypothetical protein [candidate division Zixibacteria bacterium]